MPKFHIENVAPMYKDIQRDFMFEFIIPEITRIVPFVLPEGLQTRVRSVNVPGSSITEIKSEYMGTAEYHAGKREPVTDITVNFEETGNTTIHSVFTAWAEQIVSLDPNSANAGVSAFNVKRGGYAVDAFINTFDYDGVTLLQTFRCINLWPKSVPDVSLQYSGSGAVAYDIGFKCDQCIRIV